MNRWWLQLASTIKIEIHTCARIRTSFLLTGINKLSVVSKHSCSSTTLFSESIFQTLLGKKQKRFWGDISPKYLPNQNYMSFVSLVGTVSRKLLRKLVGEKSATRFTKIQNNAYLRLSKSQARTGKAEIPTLHRKSLGTIHALSALSCFLSVFRRHSRS